MMNTANLPINAVLQDIVLAIESNAQVILEAPPGAGKTTAVPLVLLQAKSLQGGKIIMLEPRRIAAKNAALRLASLLNEPVGQTIGYRMKNDSQCSTATRIEVVTEGVLLRLLQNDPSLEGINCIIFDEFHERSLQSDLALSLTLETQELLRDEQPLKLLLMSASLQGLDFSKLLPQAKTIQSLGKSFPVAIYHSDKTIQRDQAIDQALRLTEKALLAHQGSILVFLPGQKAIQQCANYLNTRVDSQTAVLPLYGQMPLEKQQLAIKALDANSPYQRKVVLATDIAETSLTIDGIEVVIDSGLNRKPKFNANTGITALLTGFISQAQALQRAGRAGRLQAGFCYRAFSEAQFSQMPQQAKPEIQQADLTDCCLQLLLWGVSKPEQLPWLDAPPSAHFNQALTVLEKLSAINYQGGLAQLTTHGKAMAAISTAPRLAHLIIFAKQLNYLQQGLALAYLLSERSPDNASLEEQVSTLVNQRTNDRNRAWLKRAKQQMQQWQKQLASLDIKPLSHTIDATDCIGVLLASAFYDRIAHAHPSKPNIYQLSNGRQAKSHNKLHSNTQAYIAIADILTHEQNSYDTILSSAAFSKDNFKGSLAYLTSSQESFEICPQSERLIAQKQHCVGKLIISQEAMGDIQADAKQALFMQYIKQQGLQALDFTDACHTLCQRVQLAKSLGDDSLPDLSENHLLEILERWLQPFLPNTLSRASQLKSIAIKPCLLSLLTYEQQKFLASFIPETITLASGSIAHIDYQQSPPALAVKLQEMFGSTNSPSIANGKIKLQLHLLSPAKKPLQITQDIASFWQNSYQDVKKEMRGRYPKHPWPDDPLKAVATGKTKKQFSRDSH